MRTFVLFLVFGFFSCVAIAQDQNGDWQQPKSLTFESHNVRLDSTFQSAPEINKEATLVLEVKDSSTLESLNFPGNIDVILWMKMGNGGHGSAPTQLQRVLDDSGNVIVGRYLVTNIYFVMSGVWDVRIKLTNQNGVSDVQSFKIKLHGDHNGHGDSHIHQSL